MVVKFSIGPTNMKISFDITIPISERVVATFLKLSVSQVMSQDSNVNSSERPIRQKLISADTDNRPN